MKKNQKILSIVLIAYFVFLQTCNVSYSNQDNITTIKYNGVVWVALDYYSIIRYKSYDEPMKLIEVTNTKK